MTELSAETAKIREELRLRAADLATALLGTPNKALSNERELRFGSRGSLRVNIAGTRAGEFDDFETSERGDLFLLIQKVNGGDFPSARVFAQKFVGSAVVSTSQSTERENKTAKKGRTDVRRDMWANIWAESRDPRSTLVEAHFQIRGLTLTSDLCGEVLRFHPKLWFNGGRAPGMVALFRDIRTNEPCGIHRTFLDTQGNKLERKFLGRRQGAAIKLDDDGHVVLGLHIGEGIESCIAGRLAGFRPVWALGCSGGIAEFPVLGGIEALTILGEIDDGGANARAAEVCAKRWTGAGCDVAIVEPITGEDLNTIWRQVG